MKSRNLFKTVFATILTLSFFTCPTLTLAEDEEIKAPQTEEEWDDILDNDEDTGDTVIPCGITAYGSYIILSDTTDVEEVIILDYDYE